MANEHLKARHDRTSKWLGDLADRFKNESKRLAESNPDWASIYREAEKGVREVLAKQIAPLESDSISTNDVEHLAHIVICRTNLAVKSVQEFDSGSKAHEAAQEIATGGDAPGEIIVCCQVRKLESAAHRFRAERN